MTKPARLSYVFIFATLALVAWLHLATPLITALFAYFALAKFNRFGRRWLAIALFVVVGAGISYGIGWFIKNTVIALPKIVATTIPSILDYAKAHKIDLPFEDLDSFKALILDTVKDEFKMVGNIAKVAGKQVIFVVIGLVVAGSLFLKPEMDLAADGHRLRSNLYSVLCEEIAARFRSFYFSFATVMGGQLLISAINTVLTAIFVTAISLPHAPVVIGMTFFAGLLPIIGNLISNSIIVGLAFAMSPQLALAALIFLIVLHKLEYFLNSKIIGGRIKNPIWLTLLALILGERVMGIPGMILAPVVLHYIKIETSKIEVPDKEVESVAEAHR